MQRVVNMWLVYELTGSPFQLGLIGAFQAVPLLLFSLVGGAVADTVDRRKLILATQGFRGLLALVLVALSVTESLQLWHVYAVTFFGTAASVFDGPARQALLPTLVPRTHVTQAIVVNSMSFQFTRLMGPGLAGLFLAVGGTNGAYTANVLLFSLAWITFLMLRTPAVTRGESRPAMLPLMMEGLRFVAQTSVILGLLVLDVFANLFGAYEALMPVFAKDVLNVGPAGFGLLASAPAVGAVLGTIGVLFYSHFQRKGVVVLICVFVYSLALIGFGLSPWFLLTFIMAATLGCMDQIAVTFRNAIILLITPDALRGRVESIRLMFVFGSPSVGGVQAGALASVLGAPLTIAVEAVVVVGAVVGIAMRLPEIRRVRI